MTSSAARAAIALIGVALAAVSVPTRSAVPGEAEPKGAAAPAVPTASVAPETPADSVPAGPPEPIYVLGADVIVVTASKTEERVRDAPVAVTVLDSLAIEQSGTDNYADLLRRVPGVNAVQVTARDVNLTPRTATGVNARTTLALLDGRYLNQDYFGLVLWDVMPVDFDEIDRVEVIRGPGSAIWGANALTGVVNVITKTPSQMPGWSGKVGAGEGDTQEVSLRHAGRSGRLGYKASASYYGQAALERPTALPDGTPLPPYENEGTDQYRADVRFVLGEDEDSSWDLGAGFAQSSGVLVTFLGPFDSESIRQGHAGATYRRGQFTFEANVSAHDATYQDLLNPAVVDTSYRTLHLEGRNTTVLGGRHLIVYGATGRYTNFDLSLTPNEDQVSNLGAYVEDDMLIREGLRFRFGARVDWTGTIGTTVSPRTGLIWEPHPDHTLRLSYNRAYIAPNLVESFVHFPSGIPVAPGVVIPTLTVGNDDITEETIDAFEIGYTGILAERATVTFSVYRNQTDGLIRLEPIEFWTADNPPPGVTLPPQAYPLPKTFQNVNTGQRVDRGFEVSLDLRASAKVDAFVNYSFLDDPGLSSDVSFAVNVAPRHRVNIGASCRGERWYGSLSTSWTDEAFFADVLTFTGTTDAFWLVDATLGYRLPGDHVNLRLRAVNALDDKIQQHIFGDIVRRRIVGEAEFRW